MRYATATELPWRAHNPTGWQEGISAAGLEPLEEWALLKLFDHHWLRGAIPSEVSGVLSVLVANGLGRKDEKRIRVAKLLDFFPEVVPGSPMRRHPALTHEREEARRKARTSSEKGKKGAEARHRGHEGCPPGSASGTALGIPSGITPGVEIRAPGIAP